MKTRTVSIGNISLIIRQMPDGRWRCSYKDSSGKRRHITGPLDTVQAKTVQIAERLHQGEPQLAVPESELDAFRAWQASRESGISIDAAVDKFITSQERKSRRTDRTMQEMRRDMAKLVNHFLGRKIKSITIDELEQWIHLYPQHAAKTRHHRRSRVVQLWSWCRDHEFLPMAKTSAEKTAVVDYLPGRMEIFTPEQMRAVLAAVDPRYVPFVLLSAFAGIRHQEIRPDAASHKDPLRWEDIDIAEGIIRIRPETSKGRRGRSRIIPIQPVLRARLLAYLAGVPRIGPVCPYRPFTESESSRVAKAIGLARWPHNALRHSYGTYRMAVCRDAPRVSDEMGNSPADIRAHYDAVVSEAVALDFWESGTCKESLHVGSMQ